MRKYLDKTTLEIIVIIITTVGIFSVLSKYYTPEFNLSFYDGNPFAIKRDVINKVFTWIYIIVALLGVLLKLYTTISGDKLKRNFSILHYWIVFVVVAILCIPLIKSIDVLGGKISRHIWEPKIIESQKEAYTTSLVILANDGLRKEDLGKNVSEKELGVIKERNFGQVNEYFTQIEKLLEIQIFSYDLRKRKMVFEKYFDKK